MALQLNNGATSNQRASLAAPVDATNLAIAWAGWVYVDDITVATQYLLHIQDTAGALAYGMVFMFTTGPNGSVQVIRHYDGADKQSNTTGAVVANGTWAHVVIQHNGVGGTNPVEVWLNGASQTVGAASGTGTTPDSMAGSTWDLGNRDDNARPFKGRVRDAAIYTRAAGAQPLNAADVAALAAATANPATFTPAGGGTLRSFARFVGADTYDEVTGGEWTLSNSPPAVEAPHIPTASIITDPLPTTSGLVAYWSSDAGVIASSAAKNNARTVLDLSGNSTHLFNTTSAINRGKYKASGTDKVLAHPYHVAGSTRPAYWEVNNPTANHKNAAVSWLGVHWTTCVEGQCYFNDGAPVKIGKAAGGEMTVTIVATGETVTPLPKVYLQSKPMPWVVTVSDPGGSSNKVVNLYTGNGVSTVTTGTPYTMAATADLTLIGPASSASEGSRIGFKRFGTFNRELTATEAANTVSALASIVGAPASYAGQIDYEGSSSPAGNNQGREACRTLMYQLGRTGRARVFQNGVSNTGIVDRRITCAAGTAFTLDETVYQGATLGTATASGVVRYENASGEIYLTDCVGTFANGTAVKGNTSGVNRTQNQNEDTLGVGLWTASRYSTFTTRMNHATDGRRVLLLYASSNEVNKGWASPTGVDAVEILKRFVAKVKTDFAGIKVVLHTITPRSGSYGASIQSFNALVKAAAGGAYWDAVADMSADPAFDFKDASGTPDNGAYDVTQQAYTLDDTSNDAIHLSEYGAGLEAVAAGSTLAGALGLANRKKLMARRRRLAGRA